MRTVQMSLFLATEKNQHCFSGYACIALRRKHSICKHTEAGWEKEAMEAQVSGQSLPQNNIL